MELCLARIERMVAMIAWVGDGTSKRRERAVVEPQLGGYRQGLAAAPPLRFRQQDLLLHADVFEEPSAELRVCGPVDDIRTHRRLCQETIKP